VADDLVAGAVAELYGADPDVFTERRKALVAAAREAGDRAAASAIGALRKPTRAAWVVNRLARADPDAPARLAALAAELRAAERAKDGSRLRELSADRGALIDALTDRALAAAAVPDPPPSLRAEVTATLTAALADPRTAAAFAAGNLTKAAQWSGFGYGDFAADEDGPADGAPSESPPDISVARSRRRSPEAAPVAASQTAPSHPAPVRRATGATRPAASSRPTQLPRQADRAKIDQERRVAAEQERAAREAAERAARAREKFDDAERSLAQASAVAAEAGAVEDRLEAEVRDLEGRLTTAREDLAAARRHARHAEAAERRARQALDRVPRPGAGV
jgi:hypothetical protein